MLSDLEGFFCCIPIEIIYQICYNYIERWCGTMDQQKYKIVIYSDANDNQPISDYIRQLREKSKTDKNSRVNYNKIVSYIDLLCEIGTRIGEPITKHLDGEIWELRPLDNRILYAYYKDNAFILLHHFFKKTNKCPPEELEQAKRNLADHIKRSEHK